MRIPQHYRRLNLKPVSYINKSPVNLNLMDHSINYLCQQSSSLNLMQLMNHTKVSVLVYY